MSNQKISLRQVIENINNESNCNPLNKSEIAANYAARAAMDAYFIDANKIALHLEHLINEGARFDFDAALSEAMSIVVKIENQG